MGFSELREPGSGVATTGAFSHTAKRPMSRMFSPLRIRAKHLVLAFADMRKANETQRAFASRLRHMTQSVTNDNHDDDGTFSSEYQPNEFSEAVGELDLPTTAEVSEAVGCPHRTALYHLNQLEEDGVLTSRMAGRAKLWSRAAKKR
jgi:hypothetical protein